MTRFQNLRQTSSWAVFNQVGSLLQQLVSTDTIVHTEADFPQIHGRFVLVISPDFSALLLGNSINLEQCNLELTFSPDAIADFCRMIDHVPNFVLRENQSDRQSEFTLKLIELLSQSPIESAHQVEQERLLSQVTTLIRHSLNLPVILETAVHQVRDFLQADRLIIYQFNFPAPSCAIDSDIPSFREVTHNLDGITYESRSSDQIPSILNVVSEYAIPRQLQTSPQESQTWTNGRKSSEVSTMASLLKQSPNDVQAELVTPIVVQEELWGLLIVHQCQSPRQWNDREKILLQRIAEHLAIAIYQAKLYSELQQQKSTLEQQIIDRTQDLRDTLIAAQSANRIKSEFLATMSHELRSPLTTIIGMASTLLRSQDSHYKITPHKQQEYLQTIQERGEHLLALINDILDLSEVEAGRMFLRIQKFSLAELAEQTLQMLQEKAQSKQVALILELLPDRAQNFTFQADPQRVQQICLNLLSNAIKFTPAQGRVIMRVRVSGDTAILQVEDTGIGIPNHQRSFLFQKFQQLDASYHRKYEGTGLGLALTKQLVELHGGSIDVESTVGVGSKFTVFLPMQTISAIEHARQDQILE